MKENYIRLSQQAIFYLIAATVGLLPLFFIPQTANFFEPNKFILLIVATAAGFVLWGLRMVLEKRFTFTRSPLDLPILLFVFVSFIAALSSLDQFVSLVGAYGRPWPSFFAIATVSAFYFLATSNLKTRKHVEQIILVLIGSTVLASLVSLLSYFGWYFQFDFAKFHSFNTIGSPISLALLQAIVIPLAVYWVISTKDRVLFIVGTAAALIMIFSLILINFPPAFLGLVAAITFSASVMLKTKFTQSAKNGLIIIAVATFLFLAVRYVPQITQGTLINLINNKTPNTTPAQQIDTPKEVTLPQGAGWDMAAQAIGKRPLFGTGPGTFAFAFTQLKPRYLNSTSFWPVSFDKSSSDFTEIIATVGIVGTILYLILIATALRFIWALVYKGLRPGPYLAVSSAIISALVISFFSTSQLTNALVFFFALASLNVLAKAHEEKHVSELTVEVATLRNHFNWFPLGGNLGVLKTTDDKNAAKSQILPTVFLTAVIVVSFLALRYQISAFQGEYYYRQALLASQKNDGNKTLDFLQKAIVANPTIDAYHRALSQTALAIALNLNQKKDLSDSDKQILTQLVSVAVDQAKVASGYQILPLRVPGISAANVNNWAALADVYTNLIGAVSQTDVHAVNALSQAVNLDPENVILHDRLGLLYARVNNLDLAQRKFEDAAIIKSDYGPAHYHLAKILITKKGDIQRIATELALAKQLLPKDDPAISDIDTSLKDYNSQIQEAQKKAAEAQAKQTANPPAGGPSPTPVLTPSPTPTATSSAVPQVSPLPSQKPGL